MKNLNLILVFVFSFTIIFNSCEKDEVDNPVEENFIPTNFKVDIPSSINRASTKAYNNKSASIGGNDIYMHLTNFIHLGDEAAQIVEDIMISIGKNNLSQEMSFSFISEDDGREKKVVIVADSDFEGVTWQYQLTITDVLSENNEDGGVALQVFWNNGTVKGIAIIKPYNIDRNSETEFTNALFRIDYSEASENGYEQEMTVYISDIELPSPLVNPFAVSTLKMNVGKKGNVVEIYGNSNHPNAKFFTDDVGFNWAFVAAGEIDSNIGVAEVGLPPSDLDSDERAAILETHSLNNVFTNQINETWPGLDPETVASFLENTEAPGYFNSNGFVQGGTSPGSQYDNIKEAIDALTPYNPYYITNMHVAFKPN